MKPKHLKVLLPCDSLEELALERNEGDARALLGAWLIAWHPALIAAMGDVPGWLPAGDPTGSQSMEYEEPSSSASQAETIFLLPDPARSWVPAEWTEQIELDGGTILSVGGADVADVGAGEVGPLLARLLDQFEADASGVSQEQVNGVRDLGVARLLVDLLTRRMLYMHCLDEEGFRDAVVKAARTGTADEESRATRERSIDAAIELLSGARDYLYPTDNYLIDLTLVAETTLGEPFERWLREDSAPRNLLLSGHVLRRIAQEQPELLDLINAAVKRERIGLIGGTDREPPLALMPLEAIRHHLVAGLEVYERLLGLRPRVFGQRMFALTPLLPSILARLGFTAALHMSFNGGRVPETKQGRIRWQGLDHQAIEAVAHVPLDAGGDRNFFQTAERLSDSMDFEHTATELFAHWPGSVGAWYDSLRRLSMRGDHGTDTGDYMDVSRAVGTCLTVDDYFTQTAYAGADANPGVDEYRSPYLENDVAAGRPDPVSRWMRYFARWTRIDALRAWQTHANVLSDPTRLPQRDNVEEFINSIEDALTSPGTDAEEHAIDSRLSAALRATARRVAAALGAVPPTDDPADGDPADGGHEPPADERSAGSILLNPHAAPASGWASAGGTDPVEVPGFGFRFIPVAARDSQPAAPTARDRAARRWPWRKKKQVPPPMVEREEDRIVLRNEFAEITFDLHTGAIRGIGDYRTRGPRLAQQVAMRIPDPRERAADSDAHYTIPAADDWQLNAEGDQAGEVTCVGRLVDRQGNRVAGFRQTTRLRRQSRAIEIEVELEPDREPGPDPWRSYYGLRFAWNDATADLYRSVNLANVPTDATRLEAPHYVDIHAGEGGVLGGPPHRTTLLCDGLPYHRRFGMRKLDTILVVRGERARRFRLGIGIDPPHPMAAALERWLPPLELPVGQAPAMDSGWLFHLDCRHALVTHWQATPLGPWEEGDANDPAEGETTGKEMDETTGETSQSSVVGATEGSSSPDWPRPGLRVRVLEMDGRRVTARLRTPRRLLAARKLGVADQPAVALTVDDDAVEIPLGPYEWAEVEMVFEGRTSVQ